MNKSTMYGIVIFAIVIGAGLFFVKGGSDVGITGNVVAVSSGESQNLVIGMKNYNYYPNSVEIEAGKNTKLQLDDSVYGCFRDLVIRETNIRKYLASPSDVLEFTIDQPGTYTFACSMGMGSGKLIVK